MEWTFEIVEPKYSRQILPDTIEMLAHLYCQGRTLQEIGEFIGVSRERIRQLIDTSVGGRSVKAQGRRQKIAQTILKRQQEKEAKVAEFFGCSYAEVNKINGCVFNWHSRNKRGSSKTPAVAFQAQRKWAQQRGIEWKFTLPEWWQVWIDSGHWYQRGVGLTSYCMSRKGDEGAYEVGNVEIKTHSQNSAEGRKKALTKDSDGLTRRERQVLDFLRQGICSPVEIAKLTGLAPTTIGVHKVNLAKRGFMPTA